MNVSLIIFAAWWSAVLAPIEPANPKVPSPAPVSPKVPSPVLTPLNPKLDPSKLPKVTQAPKLMFKPGSYSFESLKLPEVLPLEKFEHWQGGPNWPQLESSVVVVTDHSQDPHRFMAFLVDLKEQRIAAIREGDITKHLGTIGQQGPGDDNHQQAVPQSILGLAGSGAVIVLKPPVPPGPSGIPDDLVRRILDSGNIAAQAGLLMHGTLGRG
ncbi:hypothetical protein SAMN02745121_02504 [Nannocystis exedens]|uniref:Uncharacterized protein n=1 Tax=Nannocystis exedens TaxID=54 RepID=A0A1I1WSU7_9BACT|nr:hypothetical protein [Nannocystis exedens]PCC71025.1 hypothetical protein NAEX_04094 [Nannocystis exedens]SFD98196.1 hypothetical protein SAMN02745121_02504 [Nannocystis exedens]